MYSGEREKRSDATRDRQLSAVYNHFELRRLTFFSLPFTPPPAYYPV